MMSKTPNDFKDGSIEYYPGVKLGTKLSQELNEEDTLNQKFLVAIKHGHLELTKSFIEQGANDFTMGMFYAAKNHYHKIIDLLLEQDLEYILYFVLGFGLRGAAETGDGTLIYFFIDKGSEKWNTNFWDQGLAGASRGGHIDWVQFFIKKGAKELDLAMGEAVEKGHLDIAKFLIKTGAKYWDFGMYCAAHRGDLEAIQFFIDQGAKDWDYGMVGAVYGDNLDVIQFFIDKGAKCFNKGMKAAAQEGNSDLVLFFIDLGARDWNKGLCGSAFGGKKFMVEFFIDQGATKLKKAKKISDDNCYEDLTIFLQEKIQEQKKSKKVTCALM